MENLTNSETKDLFIKIKKSIYRLKKYKSLTSSETMHV